MNKNDMNNWVVVGLILDILEHVMGIEASWSLHYASQHEWVKPMTEQTWAGNPNTNFKQN